MTRDLEWHENKKLRRMEVAAPDLLAAAEKCLSVFEELADAGNYPIPLYGNGGWKFLTDAIAKAKGEP
jgi:hypothetical protein